MLVESTRFRFLHHALGAAVVVGACLVSVPAFGSDNDRTASISVTEGVRFDNNAFVDRRGQFGADAVPHLVNLLSSEGNLTLNLKRWLTFDLDTELSTEELRFDLLEKKRTDDLRKTSSRLDTTLTFTPLTGFDIALTHGLQISREAQHEWSFLQTSPSLTLSYTVPAGLVFQVLYAYTGKFFDSTAPTETYGNIDMQSHRSEMTVKWWMARPVRLRLTASFDYQIYDHNVGDLLGRILFVPIDQYENPRAEYSPFDRKDKVVKSEMELLGVPFTWGAVAATYRYEEGWSNLDTFTYRGHGPGLAIAFKYKGHEIFAQAKLTFKDFYRFRFDTRYSDTRKDYKIDVYAKYGYVIRDWVRVDLLYSFFRNDSNDAKHFSFGHSRSYSRYQRSKVELTATFSFDFVHQSHAAPTQDVPGELMAKL